MFWEIFITASFVGLLLITIILMCGQTPSLSNLNSDNAKPIECGFEDRLNGSRSPFSLYFFILSVLFLVFDVETVLLFPTPLAINFFENIYLFISVFLFLFILLAGLIHETRQGALKWAEPSNN